MFFLVLSILFIYSGAVGEYVEVKVEQGILRGQELPSEAGGSYYGFQGVPFARPPLGELRFKAPELPHKWFGVRDAFEDGPRCSQIFDNYTIAGSEDCLYLNIFIPKTDGNFSPNAKKSVLVWIHGGGFLYEGNDKVLYGPDFLIRHDVIFVGISYRLGALGFLSTSDRHITGNFGMKDQVMALKWVQKNIHNFGGDPRRVTIFGESAGSASVSYLTVSKKTQGLFRHAISDSGTAYVPWAFTSNPKEKAFTMGRILNIHTESSEDLVRELRKIPINELLEASKEIGKNDILVEKTAPFSPVKEMHENLEEAFLTEHPAEIINKGDYNHVPYLIGMCNRDGIYPAQNWLTYKDVFTEINEDFKSALPLPLYKKAEDDSNVSKAIREFYFKNATVSEKNLPDLIKFSTESYFTFGTIVPILRQIEKSSSAVFFYVFSFQGELNLRNVSEITEDPAFTGASHADDICYLFAADRCKKAESNSPEEITRDIMTKLWTNFAKYGDPRSDENLLGVKWERVSNEDFNYLDIGRDLKTSRGFDTLQFKLWQDAYVGTPYEFNSEL